MGPQNIGETPIKSMYKALLIFIVVPLLPYVSATSGMAASTVVLEMGARKPQKERTAVMIFLRVSENLS